MKKALKIQDILIISAVTILAICVNMRIWDIDLNIPPAMDGDTFLGMAVYKSLKEYGMKGLWINRSLGLPGYSALIDVPFLDYPMAVCILVLVNIMPSEACAYYIMYILSYALAGISMYLLLSKLTESRWVNIVFSIIFSLLPYHFLRGMLHMTLAYYYVIPLGIYLAVLVYEETFCGMLPENTKGNFKKTAEILFCIFLVGISNVYYAYFSMLLILVTVVYKMIKNSTWKPLIQEAGFFYGTAIVFLAGLMPKLFYGVKYGANTVAGIRMPQETELYSLKVIQMLLPSPMSGNSILRSINEKYTLGGFNINENKMSALGTAGSIGFLVLSVWFIFKYVRGNGKGEQWKQRLDLFAVFTLILILYCTQGGFGTIFSYVITPELRCLNRASIVIDALCIAALAIVLCNFLKYKRKCLTGFVLAIALAITWFCDVPPMAEKESQAAIAAQDSVYRKFFKEVENQVEPGAMIYQLPMTEFPESEAVYQMQDYALLRGYVYADTLKWSYGGVKGRNSEAVELYVDEGMGENFIHGIRAVGFAGIYIDTDGYEDGGKKINTYYQEVLGLKPVISEDMKLYFYKLDL